MIIFMSKSCHSIRQQFINFTSIKNLHSKVTIQSTNYATHGAVKLSYQTYDNYLNKNDITAPLIVHHGLFGSKQNWHSLCKQIHKQSRRKVISVDARNHGESPHHDDHTYEDLANDIKRLLEIQGIPKASLLGHSMGGRAVMHLALTHPQLVESLIVVDISPVSSPPHMGVMNRFFDALLAVNIEKNISMPKARQSADEQLSSVITDKSVRSFLITNLKKNDDGSFSWRLNIPAIQKNYINIGKFPKFSKEFYDGPTMFIKGADSDFIQATDYPKIQKLFPKAEFKTIEDAGHWVHYEQPQELLKLVLDFLNQSSKSV